MTKKTSVISGSTCLRNIQGCQPPAAIELAGVGDGGSTTTPDPDPE
ncbi:unannotated protein [freshwater metagenome]|uniref:Unannotated protein n=1 Tax=freshwater metagenome TaxID=449393 RepID=A0A6J7DTG2_9ZZZZ